MASRIISQTLDGIVSSYAARVAMNRPASSTSKPYSCLRFSPSKQVKLAISIATLVVAIVSVVFDVRTFYTSDEANKPSLICYCNTNTSTSKPYDGVRQDHSTEQAVKNVLKRENDNAGEYYDNGNNHDTDDNNEPTFRIGNKRQPPLPTVTATNFLDSERRSPLKTNLLFAFATTIGGGGGSLIGNNPDGHITIEPAKSASTVSHATPMYPIEQDEQSSHPHGSLSWYRACNAVQRRVVAAKAKLTSHCPSTCPLLLQLRTRSYRRSPTSPLSDWCDELEQQYLEARWAAVRDACPPLSQADKCSKLPQTTRPYRAVTYNFMASVTADIAAILDVTILTTTVAAIFDVIVATDDAAPLSTTIAAVVPVTLTANDAAWISTIITSFVPITLTATFTYTPTGRPATPGDISMAVPKPGHAMKTGMASQGYTMAAPKPIHFITSTRTGTIAAAAAAAAAVTTATADALIARSSSGQVAAEAATISVIGLVCASLFLGFSGCLVFIVRKSLLKRR